jgi:outer membrane protein OmpA-like peptidoglycan-associated protein
MNSLNLTLKTGLTLVLFGAASACASAQPPAELVDARAAYARASTGEAKDVSPTALHDAKVALDRAEQAFNDKPDSDGTRDAAYIATRKAQLAEVVASTALAKRDEEQNKAKSDANLRASANQAQGALTQTREQLAQTSQQLETEKTARADAEKKAREALNKLAMANALAVKDEPRGTVITVPAGVLFASGKSDLLGTASSKLQQVAEALKNEPDRKLTIEGHTDSQGSDQSNMELSQRRAQTVQAFFVSQGISADKITATGVGESRPIADNASPEGRANNRRVEIIVDRSEAR